VATKKLPEIAPNQVLGQLEISIMGASGWLKECDQTALALAYRLATVIDTICNTGEGLEQLPALAGRYLGLLKELKLTPVARDTDTKTVESVDNGTKFAENYLRLIDSANSKPTATRAKSGAAGKRPSGRSGAAAAGVAEIRTK
jgi:hypothetical protein